MDKWKKKLSGALIASVLALTLSSKAYADPVDEPAPDLPVPQYEEKAADTGSTNTPANVSPSSDKTEPPKTDTSSRDITPESKGPASEVKSASQEATASNTDSNISDGSSKGAPVSSGSSDPASETPLSEGGSVDASKGASASENGSAGTDNSVSVSVTNTVTDIENNTNVTVDNVTDGEGGDIISTLTLTDGGTISGADNKNGGNIVFTRNASFNLNSSQGTDPENFSGDGETDPAGKTRSGGESDPAENSGSEEPGTITLGSTTFTPGQDPSTDLSSTTTAKDDSFGFDAGTTDAASDDSFYMVDYDGSSQTLASTNSDINIKAAGLNRLGSIQADGDVNITGTGILLVDSLSISENHNFFLHPIEGLYDSGSVAVFLKTNTSGSTGSSSGSGSSNTVYQLINSSAAPGILDDSYEIPAGIDLVLPSGSSLILHSLIHETVEEHPDKNGNPVSASSTTYSTQPNYSDYYANTNYYTFEPSAAHLTIPASSGLTVQSGASVSMNTLCGPFGGDQVISTLTVNGSLDNSGIIDGSRYKGVVELGETSVITGNGVYNDCRLFFNSLNQGPHLLTLNITGNSTLFLGCDVENSIDHALTAEERSVDVDNLNIDGSCKMIISGGSSIGSINLNNSSKLEVSAHNSYKNGCPITLRNGITGSGSILFTSGNYFITNSLFELGSSITASAGSNAVTVSDITGQLSSRLATTGLAISVNPDAVASGLPLSAVPVYTISVENEDDFGDDSILWKVSDISSINDARTIDLNGKGLISDGKLSLPALGTYYSEKLTDEDSYIEVYSISNNTLTRHIIKKIGSGFTQGSIPADEIILIRLVRESGSCVAPASSVLSTNSSVTGSGVLGGSGAGSVNGGTGTQIDLSFFNTGNNQGNGNGDSGNDNSQGNGNDNSGNGNSQGNGNDNSGNGNTVIPGTTGGNQAAANQTNDSSSNQEDNSSASGEAYITPEDIKPDVKPEDLVITVTEQETVSVSSNANSQAASTHQTASVSLEEAEPVYTLAVTVEDQQVTKLNEKITVRFSCPAPKTNRQIFAVFRDKDGSLKAFKARYDKIKKQLVFDTDLLGDFAVVCIDYKGTLYSEEFYEFLETFDSVKTLE